MSSSWRSREVSFIHSPCWALGLQAHEHQGLVPNRYRGDRSPREIIWGNEASSIEPEPPGGVFVRVGGPSEAPSMNSEAEGGRAPNRQNVPWQPGSPVCLCSPFYPQSGDVEDNSQGSPEARIKRSLHICCTL